MAASVFWLEVDKDINTYEKYFRKNCKPLHHLIMFKGCTLIHKMLSQNLFLYYVFPQGCAMAQGPVEINELI